MEILCHWLPDINLASIKLLLTGMCKVIFGKICKNQNRVKGYMINIYVTENFFSRSVDLLIIFSINAHKDCVGH